MSTQIGCRSALDLSSEWGQQVLAEAIARVGNGGYMPPQAEDFNTEDHMAILLQSLLFELNSLESKVESLEEHIDSLTPYLTDEYFDS